METRIIEATPSQYEEIYGLMKEFADFQRTPGKFTISLEQMLTNKDLFNCLLAVSGDRIIGLATYFYAYYSWTGKALYLDDLFVTKQFRGNGAGTLLFEAIVEKAKKEQCTRLRWQVSRWNEEAIKFYRERGAIVDEIEINCDLHFLP